jgi:integrase
MPKIVAPLTKTRIENEKARRADRVKEINKELAKLLKEGKHDTGNALHDERELLSKLHYTLTDGNGLTLEVDHERAPGKTHIWRQWFVNPETRKRSKINHEVSWPTLSIEEAREWGKQIVKGTKVAKVSPVAVRRDERVAKVQAAALAKENARLVSTGEALVNTVQYIGKEVLKLDGEKRKGSTNDKYKTAFELDICPVIGAMYFPEVKTSHILQIYANIRARPQGTSGNTTVIKCAKHVLSETFREAVDRGLIDAVPLLEPARSSKIARPPATPYASLSTIEELGEFMATLDSVDNPAHFSPRNGLLLSLATGQRRDTIRLMEWTEIDWEKCLWTIPRHKMKGRLVAQQSKHGLPAKPHYVPLSRQVMELLQSLREEQDKGRTSQWVFPADKQPADGDIPMGKGVMNTLLKSLGWQGLHTQHGCRASLRSIYPELFGSTGKLVGGYDGQSEDITFNAELALEIQLDHTHGKEMKKVTGGHARTYYRASMTDERRVIAQNWSNALEKAWKACGVVGSAREIPAVVAPLRLVA